MKKFLPLILILVGIGVITAAFLFVRGRGKKGVVIEESVLLAEVVLADRPVAILTPSDDGHWLKMVIEKFKIEAASMDYELLYKLPDGRTQGVPGTIKLTGQGSIERDLLLGSESSGKFRYDEGVTEGTLALRFRNDRGKLLIKFMTDFHLQSGDKSLTSVNGNFTYMLDKTAKGDFFVTMETFGIPELPEGDVGAGPYGVFGSASTKLPGEVSLGSGNTYRWTGAKWVQLDGSESSDIGIFVSVNQPS